MVADLLQARLASVQHVQHAGRHHLPHRTPRVQQQRLGEVEVDVLHGGEATPVAGHHQRERVVPEDGSQVLRLLLPFYGRLGDGGGAGGRVRGGGVLSLLANLPSALQHR